MSNYSSFESSQIWLFHCRLGHPSFFCFNVYVPFLIDQRVYWVI